MTDMATVATNLRDIEDMAHRLEARAIDRATAREMPGGDAMVNLASVGSLGDWQRRLDVAETMYGNGSIDISTEDPDQRWPAVQVLWYWSENYRATLNHDHDDPRWRPTLISEAKFLRNHDVAEWIWNNEPKWDNYAADVELAKTKLENILIEGERSERTAVVCDRCDAGRQLIRVYADREHVADECQDCGGLYDPGALDDCPLCEISLQPVYNSDPADDRWKCPGCKTKLTTDELQTAREKQMRRTTPREWISRGEAIDLLRDMGHQERVAARLVDDATTPAWCNRVTHARMVSWPDVWRRHLTEMQARRMRTEKTDARKASA